MFKELYMENIIKLKAMRSIAIIALAAVIGFSFAACDDGGGSHTHSWGAWRSNATQHWKECSCGEEYGRGNHTFDGDICSVCGYGGTDYYPDSLDGDWQNQSGSVIVTISGSTGVYKHYNSSDPLMQDAVSKGYIEIGGLLYRNLTKTGDLTWTGQSHTILYYTSSPNVAVGSDWRNCTITMDANGLTYTIVSYRNEDGSISSTNNYTRITTTSGERDSRLVNGLNDAWVGSYYSGDGHIFKADGTYQYFNDWDGSMQVKDQGTWTTSGNNSLTTITTFLGEFTYSYTVNGNNLTLEDVLAVTYYTKQTVSVIGR